jgi:hypothetical protein
LVRTESIQKERSVAGDLYSVGGTHGMPFEKVGFVSGFVTDDRAAASFKE